MQRPMGRIGVASAYVGGWQDGRGVADIVGNIPVVFDREREKEPCYPSFPAPNIQNFMTKSAVSPVDLACHHAS